jgi:hypothetical protein
MTTLEVDHAASRSEEKSRDIVLIEAMGGFPLKGRIISQSTLLKGAFPDAWDTVIRAFKAAR